MFNVLAESDSWWVRWLKEFFSWVWGWFYRALIALAVWVVGLVVMVIPDNWCPAFDKLLVYFEYANCWVALDFGFGMLAIYIMYEIVFITVKFLLKLIPGIG